MASLISFSETIDFLLRTDMIPDSLTIFEMSAPLRPGVS